MKILDEFCSFGGGRNLIDLEEYLRTCRLAVNFSSESTACIAALDVLESAIKKCHEALKNRLVEFPKPDVYISTSVVLRIVGLLRNYKFNEIVELGSAGEFWLADDSSPKRYTPNPVSADLQ